MAIAQHEQTAKPGCALNGFEGPLSGLQLKPPKTLSFLVDDRWFEAERLRDVLGDAVERLVFPLPGPEHRRAIHKVCRKTSSANPKGQCRSGVFDVGLVDVAGKERVAVNQDLTLVSDDDVERNVVLGPLIGVDQTEAVRCALKREAYLARYEASVGNFVDEKFNVMH